MPDRPQRSKAGQVSVNVPASVMDSVDQVFDALGLPEPGGVIYRLTPDNVADALGIPTLDDLSDDFLADLDRDFGIDQPTER